MHESAQGEHENDPIHEEHDGQFGKTDNDTINSLLESEEFKQEIHRLVNMQLNKTASLGLSDLTNGYKNAKSRVQDGLSLPVSSPVNGRSPIIPINDIRPDALRIMNEEEKTLRCKLASLYRLVDIHGWTHGIYNHITVRLSEGKNVFLINPFGLLYHEISASNLVKIDENGNLLERGVSHLGVNKAGWLLHSAIHEGRPDIHCVLHLHLPDVVAVSCMKCGLLPVSAEAEELLYDEPADDGEGLTEVVPEPGRGMVRYHAYRGIFIDESERTSLVEDLGPRAQILFLRNHGVAVCGRSIEEAWQLTRCVVNACQAQTQLVHLGGLNMVASSADGFGSQMSTLFRRGKERLKSATLEFEAMMRLLDNAGYRTGYRYQNPLLMNRVLDSLAEIAKENLGEESTLSSSLVPPSNHHYNEVKSLNHLEEIRKQVTENRQKASQRNQYLKNSSPRDVKSPTRNGIADKNESKPLDGETAPVLTMEVASGPLSPPILSGESDVETHLNSSKVDHHADDAERSHKKGLKIGGIHIPSFSRKKK